MIEYELCPKCLSVTPLIDSILIFDDIQNSTVSYTGKCPLCDGAVKGVDYPLTKDNIQEG